MLSFTWSTLRLRSFLIGILGGMLFLLLPLMLVIPTAALAQGNSAIAQEFQTKDRGVTTASLVSVVQGTSNAVELANRDRVDRLVGVVSSQAVIQLSEGGSGVQVVTSGLTMAFVSDLNGDVRAGDKVTVSAIEGVGMRADVPATIVGAAQANLKDSQLETRTLKDSAGKDVTVHIGLVPVQVSVSYYNPEAGKKPSIVPSFLQNIANSVSGKDVSPVRVLVAALILLLLFVSVTVLLYSSVRSSIISIGRNPLSEGAVRKSLLQVGATVLALLVFAVTAMYLVLIA